MYVRVFGHETTYLGTYLGRYLNIPYGGSFEKSVTHGSWAEFP
jgi:hypothetical protein